jgi:hypothetical protein
MEMVLWELIRYPHTKYYQLKLTEMLTALHCPDV